MLPVTLALFKVKGEAPLLLIVTVCGAEGLPTAWLPKAIVLPLAGEKLATGVVGAEAGLLASPAITG